MKRQETEQESEQESEEESEQETEQEQEHKFITNGPTGPMQQFKFRRIRAGRIQQNGNTSVLCPR
jgi:hypothetical protein